MSERFAQSNTMPCITSVAPTISKLMGISSPADSGSDCLYAFSEFSKSMNVYWQKYNRMIWFAPDHGAYIDGQSGKGIHGDNIPEDMQVQHYIGIKPGKNDISRAS